MIYELRHIYTAPGNDSNGHTPHTFQAGDHVEGKLYKPSGKRQPAIPMIKTENGYLIPQASVLATGPEEEEIETNESVVAETTASASGEAPAEQEPEPEQNESAEQTISADGNVSEPETVEQVSDEFYQQLDEIKNTDIIQKAIVKSRNSVNGSLIGAGIGLGVGIVWRKNMMLSIVIGAIFGGLIGNAWATDFRKAKNKIVPKS